LVRQECKWRRYQFAEISANSFTLMINEPIIVGSIEQSPGGDSLQDFLAGFAP
jgi:hypothetical protein